jgi:hypothetical protein
MAQRMGDIRRSVCGTCALESTTPRGVDVIPDARQAAETGHQFLGNADQDHIR